MDLSINIKRVAILALSVVFAVVAVLPFLASASAAVNDNGDSGHPFVRITYMCQAPETGIVNQFAIGDQFQDVDVNAGDHIWRVRYETNRSDVNAPDSVDFTVNRAGISGSINKGEVIFATTELAINGVSVTTIPENLYRGTASVSGSICEMKEEFFFQFAKEWEGDVEQIDLDAVEVTFVADGEFEWTLGEDAAVPVVPGETRLTNVREVVSGLPEQCSVIEATSPAGDFPLSTLEVPVPSRDIIYDENNTLTLTVTNTVECDEGDVLGDEDEKEDEGEILATTTVRSLPETGSSAGIVASIGAVVAAALAMASTAIRSAFVRFTA